ncbi:MAG: hypothetical protein AB1599_03250 [Planctomycetota bacterium]
MVKFSDISKLWKEPDEDPKKEGKHKKPSSPDKESQHHPGHLKPPEVPSARLVRINNTVENPPSDTVKYPAADARPKGDATRLTDLPDRQAGGQVGAPREEISFRNIAPAGAGAPDDAKLNIAEVARQDDKIEQAASALYDRLYSANQEVIGHINANTPNRIDIRELIQLIKDTVSFIAGNQPVLVGFAYRQPKPDYFISHQINVVLFSLSIGSGLGYNQNQLEELGLTAFLHDVTMRELLNIVDDEEQRKPASNEVIRNYIKSGLQLLRQVPLLPAVILEVCRQYHENYHHPPLFRSYGVAKDSSNSGAPPFGASLASGWVHEYAQIMMVADKFESLTHYRPNRKTKTAQAALRELVETADTDFARKALKILIRQVGIYPVGTFVLLNTQEIAEVVRANDNFPLRPVVNVLYAPACAEASAGRSEGKLAVLRTVDLLNTPSLYVSGTLTREDALGRGNPSR